MNHCGCGARVYGGRDRCDKCMTPRAAVAVAPSRVWTSRCHECREDFELPEGHARPFCSPCLERLKADDAERSRRIASGDIKLFYGDLSKAEQDAVLRARAAVNITGA